MFVFDFVLCCWTILICVILVRGFCWAIAVRESSFLLIFGFVCLFLGRGELGVYCFGRRVRRVSYFAALGVLIDEVHNAIKSDSSKWIVLLSAAFVLWRGSVFARG